MATNVIVKVTAATLVIATNWTSIGTFQDKSGRYYDVLQSSVTTNHVGKMEAEGQTVEFIFKSSSGPTNETLKLVPIGTQGNGNVPPPLPINPRFIYDRQVVVPVTNFTATPTNK